MSNPIEAYYKLMDSIEYQMSLSFYHRAVIVFICGLLIYAIAISFMYFDRRVEKK